MNFNIDNFKFLRSDLTDQTPKMALPKLTLKELENEPYLMAIDGKVYDVKTFSKVHPGGDDLLYFASRDATYHYRSLHAAHGT